MQNQNFQIFILLHLTSSCLHHLFINPIQSSPHHLLLLIFFINTIPRHKPQPSHSLDLKSMAETLAPFFSSSSFSPPHHLLSPSSAAPSFSLVTFRFLSRYLYCAHERRLEWALRMRVGSGWRGVSAEGWGGGVAGVRSECLLCG